MIYVGTYFGMGVGKSLIIFIFFIIGCALGLNKKVATSSIVFLFIYLGSLFSKGNGRIYTILIFFLLSLYLSKKLSFKINKITKNKFVKFFI